MDNSFRFFFSAEEILYKENLDQQAFPVNTLMKGYITHNQANSAVQLAQSLPKTERNIVTFLLWANAIAQIGDSKLADQIHTEIDSLSASTRAFFENDQRFLNALIDVCHSSSENTIKFFILDGWKMWKYSSNGRNIQKNETTRYHHIHNHC